MESSVIIKMDATGKKTSIINPNVSKLFSLLLVAEIQELIYWPIKIKFTIRISGFFKRLWIPYLQSNPALFIINMYLPDKQLSYCFVAKVNYQLSILFARTHSREYWVIIENAMSMYLKPKNSTPQWRNNSTKSVTNASLMLKITCWLLSHLMLKREPFIPNSWSIFILNSTKKIFLWFSAVRLIRSESTRSR